MLTAPELAAIQATQLLTLTDACTITRRALVSDGAGGQTETWPTTITTTCRVAPVAASEAVLAGQQRIVANWKITLPANTDVRGEDRIVVGARSFEVVAIMGPETRESARIVLCQER